MLTGEKINQLARDIDKVYQDNDSKIDKECKVWMLITQRLFFTFECQEDKRRKIKDLYDYFDRILKQRGS